TREFFDEERLTVRELHEVLDLLARGGRSQQLCNRARGQVAQWLELDLDARGVGFAEAALPVGHGAVEGGPRQDEKTNRGLHTLFEEPEQQIHRALVAPLCV